MPANESWKRIQEVLAEEDVKLREIRGRRSGGEIPDAIENTIGIACSGGGIRSATLNLGILEVLREKQILEQADYLSTVSGGGFVGGWLVASAYHSPDWLKRSFAGGLTSQSPSGLVQGGGRKESASVI